MKKKLVLLLALIMVFTVFATACGGSNSGGNEAKEEAAPAEEATETEEAEEAEEAAPAEEPASDGGTFVVRAVGDPTTWNPNTTGDDNLYPIAQNVYMRLCALDASKANLVGEAAESWEFNDDATELTFHLRQDLKWTDGNPLTSADVKYTFDVIKNNAQYYFSGNMQNVTEVVCPDDYTVTFKLSAPDASFDKVLGWYGTFILSHIAYEDAPDWENSKANDEPVTCGPFIVDEIRAGESITLVPNTEFPEPAKLSKLIFSNVPDEQTAVEAIKNGELDYMEGIPAANIAELEAIPEVTMVDAIYPSPMRMVFNMENEILQDPNLRRAIAMCVDREEAHKKIFLGQTMPPENCLYPSVVAWAANTEDTAPDFDPEGAKALLEANGYKADADGNYIKPGVLTITAFEGYGYPDTAKLIAAHMTEIGIPCEVEVFDYASWDAKVSDMDFTIEFQGGFMGPDPVAMTSRYGTGGGGNAGHYSNPKVDELLAQGVAVADQAERAKIYKEVQTILAEDLPKVPVLGYSAKVAYTSAFKNLPEDGEGKWGWADYSHVEPAN